MSRTGLLFVGGLWLAGLASGIVLARAPEAIPLPIPHFTIALAIGLLADLALMPATKTGRLAPLTTNERGIGVIGAALVSFGTAALLGS